jgi:hypothetical protein
MPPSAAGSFGSIARVGPMSLNPTIDMRPKEQPITESACGGVPAWRDHVHVAITCMSRSRPAVAKEGRNSVNCCRLEPLGQRAKD